MTAAVEVLEKNRDQGMAEMMQAWDQVKTHVAEKDDRVANFEAMLFRPRDNQMTLELSGMDQARELTPTAFRQIGTHLGIPAKYADKLMAEHPELMAWNLNELAHLHPDQTRMVRMLGQKVRAFLSNRYAPRDNFDLLEAILPTILASGSSYQVMSANVDENRLYLKFVSRNVYFDLSHQSHKFHESDVMFAGLCISNNEVGQGSTTVEPFFFNSWCENTAISVAAFRKYHVGRAWDPGEDVSRLLTEGTRRKTEEVFFDQVKDVVAASFDQLQFQESAQKWIQAKDQEIPRSAKVEAVVEKVGTRVGLDQKEREGVLDSLVKAAAHNGLNQYAVANAVTAQAKLADTYDRATDLERAGSKVIDITPRDWEATMATSQVVN